MLTPDRWPTRYPAARECTSAELLDFAMVASRSPDLFTDWERDFLGSLRRHLRWAGPTRRQIETLDKGLLRKLWSHDPDLWR
jgi:hypothetical protein